MMEMLRGFQLSQALYVATKLEVPDMLTEGPRPVAEIAAAASTHENSLYRILRTLSSAEVMEENPPGTFALTPLGTTLTSSAASSLRDMTLMFMETHYGPFGDLLHTAKTGEPAAAHHYGMPFWEWLASQPEQVAQFSAAMANITGSLRRNAINSLDWSGVNTLVDIGGADGTILALIPEREPSIQGILFDLPHVVQQASDVLAAHGVDSRVEIRGGSFFESVPAGADTYFLSSILHDWNDEECVGILRQIKAAAAPGARLRILELVMPSDKVPFMTAMADLTMLAMITGRERSATEWEAVIAHAGLVECRISPTPTPLFLIEATVPN